MVAVYVTGKHLEHRKKGHVIGNSVTHMQCHRQVVDYLLYIIYGGIPVGTKCGIDINIMSTVDVKNKMESFYGVNCQHQININYWHQIDVTH